MESEGLIWTLYGWSMRNIRYTYAIPIKYPAIYGLGGCVICY